MTTKWNLTDSQGRQGIAIVEGIIARNGHIFREQTVNDVGVDAHVELVEEKTSDATGQLVALQIKSGSSYFKETTANAFIFRGEMKHLDYWLNHSLPVFLVLVDTVKQQAFWQQISPVVAKRIDKGWKVEVPITHNLEINFMAAARELVGFDAKTSDYTRLTLKDTSTVNAKRYTATILMRRPINRLRAEAIVRRATADIRKERYHYSKKFEELFHGQDAVVVSLFVAGNLEDAENANWYCRTLWIAKDLAVEFRPVQIGGLNLGEGLEIIWTENYETASQIYRGRQIDKHEFLAKTTAIIARVQKLAGDAFSNSSQITCSLESVSQYGKLMRDLYLESNKIGIPPYECSGISERFGDVMTFADNAFIYTNKTIEEPQNQGWGVLLETALRDYQKNLNYFQYELTKAR